MDDKTCIYCKRTGIPFTREHVIPEAFGTYEPETMVLRDAVCSECNKRFGSELDLILSRDSFEALLRAEFLGERKGKRDRFKPRRSSIRFPDQPRFGDLRGARVEIDWATRQRFFPDQIVGRDSQGRLLSFTADEFLAADDAVVRDFPPGSLLILAMSDAGKAALEEVIKKRGRQLIKSWIFPVPDAARAPRIDVEVFGFADVTTMRAIAKVAFNYLAYIKGGSYVLDAKFDPIRAYVNGEKADRAMVKILNKPILTDETYHWRAFDGHLVVFFRAKQGLRGKIALFNSITYEVMLCTDMGLLYRMFSGHAFDPVARRIAPIHNTSLDMPARIRF